LFHLAVVKGFLTGKIDANTKFDKNDFRKHRPSFFTPDARKLTRPWSDLLGQFAKQKKATPAQSRFAWLLAPEAVDCFPSGHHEAARLDENIGSEC